MKKTALQLMKELIEIPSVFPGEEKIAKYCADFLNKAGFDVKLVPIEKKRFNVVAVKGNQKKCILLFGHLDTVPAYNYRKNPCKMHARGDTISGLGSWDMKSGLAIVMSCAKDTNPKKIGLKIVFSADEENSSLGSHITYTKDFLKNVILAITPEIVDDVSKTKDKNVVLLGRRGRVVYKVDVYGISGHGASLSGVSAISVASGLVEYFEKAKFKKDNFLGNTTIFVRKIDGNSTSLSLPEKCTMLLDVHYVPPYTKEKLLEDIKKLINQKFQDYLSSGIKISAEIQKRNTSYLDPYITDKNNSYVKRFLNLLSKKTGRLKISAGLTVADENIVANLGVPVITLGPIGGGAHSSTEWVSKKSVEELERLYKEIIGSLVK